MKIDPNSFYVVYNPTDISEKVDIFSGRLNNLKGIYLQIKGGLRNDQVYGFYNSKAAAQRDADMLWRKHKNLNKGATYGIYSADGTFQFKKKFANQESLQVFLDEMYGQAKQYAAYKLTESPKKITKAQLKKFKKKIDASDLNDQDLESLMQLYIVLEENPASSGMTLAHSFDTFQREFIPNDIWIAMGGELNKP